MAIKNGDLWEFDNTHGWHGAQLTHRGGITKFALSPNGAIAFVTDQNSPDHSLFIYANGKITAVDKSDYSFPFAPAWLDAETLVVGRVSQGNTQNLNGNDGGIWVVSRSQKPHRVIPGEKNDLYTIVGQQFLLSPDSRHVAYGYMLSGGFFLRTADTQKWRREIFGGVDYKYGVSSFCWKDNQSVLLGADTRIGYSPQLKNAAVCSLDIATHRLTPWLEEPDSAVTGLVASPSSKWIAVLSESLKPTSDDRPLPTKIDIFSSDGKLARSVIVQKPVQMFELSSDGSTALVTTTDQKNGASQSSGCLLDTATGNLSLIGSGISQLAWMAQGH
jgi:hypothetical protein